MAGRAFQVDLRGVVDLLSHHLYSGPQVYVRELLQNAVDAVTARRGTEPDAPADIVIVPADASPDGRLTVTDPGVGLTAEQVEQFLATIGRSSKRDELGFARTDLLGQFGIGLLSCFLVTDEVELVTRSADGSPAVLWRGRADGSYEVLEDPGPDVEARLPDGGVGTCVALSPRRGSEDWLSGPAVRRLAGRYGGLLPYPVRVLDGDRPVDVTLGEPPWERTGSPAVRRAALTDHVRRELGVEPFDVLPVEVPEAGLRGVAAILGEATGTGTRQAHRVHLKRMLLGDTVEGLLPDWAFFVRCSVDASGLRPTASREALYDDELLATVRESLGDQVRAWLSRLAATDPDRMAAFLRLHHLGVKALALHDDEMLRVVLPWLPFETTLGSVTLEEFRRTHPVVRYTRTVDEFRQVAAVAGAQGVGVVNGGYVYDAQLVERLTVVDPDAQVSAIAPADLDAHVAALDPETALRLRPLLAAARATLDRLGCDVEVRVFDPVTLPALYLDDRDARHRRDSRAVAQDADPLWAGLLGDLDDGGSDRPRLLLNHRNPTVRRVADLTDPGLLALAVESLYCQALLLGHRPLRPADAAALNRSFLGLLDWAVRPDGEEPQ